MLLNETYLVAYICSINASTRSLKCLILRRTMYASTRYAVLLLFACALLFSVDAFPEDDPLRTLLPYNRNARASKGNEFFVGFMPNVQEFRANTYTLFITTDEPVPVLVTIQSDYNSFSTMITAEYGRTVPVPLPSDIGVTWAGVSNKALYVKADGDRKISMYGFVHTPSSSDAFQVFPCHDYPGVTVQPAYMVMSGEGTTSRSQYSTFLVITCGRTTNIRVYPSQRILPPGESISIGPHETTKLYRTTLSNREAYLFTDLDDLTGTVIRASNPIAVFTGHQCSHVPLGVTACDHLVEQVPPHYTWGTLFFTLPVSGRTSGEEYRVGSVTADTQVTVTCTWRDSDTGTMKTQQMIAGGNPTGAHQSNWISFDTVHGDNPEFCCIESTKPVLVMQYSKGHSLNTPASTNGDPFMAMVPPVHQYANNFTVTSANNISDVFTGSLQIAVSAEFFNNSVADRQKVIVNGEPFDQNTSTLMVEDWKAINCQNGRVCGYAARKDVGKGDFNIYYDDPVAGLMVEVTVQASEVSFGYIAGLEFEAIGAILLVVSDFVVREDAGPAIVTVRDVGNSGMSLEGSISLRTRQINATNAATDGADYTGITESMINTLPFVIIIPIQNDDIMEGNELFEVEIIESSLVGSNAIALKPVGIVTILELQDFCMFDERQFELGEMEFMQAGNDQCTVSNCTENGFDTSNIDCLARQKELESCNSSFSDYDRRLSECCGFCMAQMRCYRSFPCGGINFFLVTQIQDCCLSDDGILVEINDAGECETCRVFGWISGDTDPNNRLKRIISFPETGERQPLVVGFSKGIPTIDAYDIVLHGTVTEGTASIEEDFRLEGDINSILVSFFKIGSAEQGGPTTNIPVIIQTDDIALEPDEDFSLSFEITFQDPGNQLNGVAVSIINELQVIIQDQTELSVEFTKFEYSQDENQGSLVVALLISAGIASDLRLQIVAQELTQVYPGLLMENSAGAPAKLPDGFPVLDKFNPDEPYIASNMTDYSTTEVSIKFTAGPLRTMQTSIDIINDEIYEADKEYFILFLETNDTRVDLSTGRFAAWCSIRDDEGVIIGFEETALTVFEDVGQVELCLVVKFPTPDVLFTDFYRIGVETVALTGGSADYNEIMETRLLFTNENRHHCFNVTIIDDELFEDNEQFIVTALENPLVFTNIVRLNLDPDQVNISIIDQDASAQVRCYQNTTCENTDFFIATSIEDCCLHNDGILVWVNGTKQCETCRVFGWISGETDPSSPFKKAISFDEARKMQQLVVGFSKGIPTDMYDIILSRTVTIGTARQGAVYDFILEGDDIIQITTGQSGPNTTVPVIIQLDDIALEPKEDFVLSFEITFQSPNNLFTGSAVFIVSELQVFIVDQTELTVQFTELDYTQDESGGSLPVAVLITTEIASDLRVKIVTQNLTQVYGPLTKGSTGSEVIPLPDGFDELDPFDPNQPYIASSVDGAIARVDYDTSTQFITFTAGPARTIQAPVTVYDDYIDEADKEHFVMLLETDDPRVDLTRGQFAARGTIRDNEVTCISFEMPTYTFTEASSNESIILITREDNQVSELTFSVRISYISLTAIYGKDFYYQEALYDTEIKPEEDNTPIPIRVLDDLVLEGTETFLLDMFNIGNTSFSAGKFPSATVFILDNDDPEDVVIGFEMTELTVSENVGLVELCLVVISDVNITTVYRIGAETIVGTAGIADYQEIMGVESPRLFFTNENRRHCFSVNVTDDDVFEDNEFFTVEARENPPFFTDLNGVRLDPDRNSVSITISNLGMPMIKWEMAEYSFAENVEMGEVCVVKDIATDDPLTVRVSTSEISPVEAENGEDFTAGIVSVTFQPEDRRACTNITIIDDSVSEGKERFDVSLLKVIGAVVGESVKIAIIDDEVLTITFVEKIFLAPEDNGTVTVCFNTSIGNSEELVVEVSSDPATATDVDFIPATKNITFPPATTGQVQCAEFNITDDNIALEGNETFDLTITNISHVMAHPRTYGMAQGMIIDNDDVTVTFEKPHQIVREEEGNMTVCINISTAVAQPVNVTLDAREQSILNAGDFIVPVRPVMSTILMLDSMTECTDFTIIATLKGNTTFIVAITKTDPVVGISPSNTTVITILERRVVTISLERTIYIANEGETIVICAILSGDLHKAVSVTLKILEDTATSADYFANTPVTFTYMPGGNTIMCIDVLIISDDTFEGAEFFTANLTTVDPAVILEPFSASIEIIDNDAGALNTAVIAVGAVAGVLVLVILVIVMMICCTWKRTKKELHPDVELDELHPYRDNHIYDEIGEHDYDRIIEPQGQVQGAVENKPVHPPPSEENQAQVVQYEEIQYYEAIQRVYNVIQTYEHVPYLYESVKNYCYERVHETYESVHTQTYEHVRDFYESVQTYERVMETYESVPMQTYERVMETYESVPVQTCERVQETDESVPVQTCERVQETDESVPVQTCERVQETDESVPVQTCERVLETDESVPVQTYEKVEEMYKKVQETYEKIQKTYEKVRETYERIQSPYESVPAQVYERVQHYYESVPQKDSN